LFLRNFTLQRHLAALAAALHEVELPETAVITAPARSRPA
jgi:hypothetical protein